MRLLVARIAFIAAKVRVSRKMRFSLTEAVVLV